MKLWEKRTPLYNESFGSPEPEMHLYLADGGRTRGCVVVCAGGGYQGRAWHEDKAYAQYLQSRGINAVTVDYRVAPYTYPTELLDVQRAIRTVRYHAEEWNVLPDKIAVCGSSAGGHLAVMSAEHFDYGKDDGDEIDKMSCRPDAAVLCYAVATLGKYTDRETAENITGGDRSLRVRLTGEKNVPDDCPPMFIWHTIGDGAVSVENAILMTRALDKKKIPFEAHLFPEGGHGMGLARESAPHTAQWSGLLIKWLEFNGFKGEKA